MAKTLESVQAKFVLGLLTSDELPLVAQDLVAEGYESDALVELAASSGESQDKVLKLFATALAQLDKKLMSKEVALRQFAKDVSNLILSAKLTPLEGARRIWDAFKNAHIAGFHELDPFIYAASEAEDRPKDARRFEQGIVEEAKQWAKKRIT
jgi:hypothetical protein